MKKYILILLLLLSSTLLAFDYIITPKELNEKIQQKFPLEKKFLFSTLTFSNPNLSIYKENNFINFDCDVQSPALRLEDGSVAKFKVFGTSSINYDGDNIYLENVKIEQIQNNSLSPQFAQKVKGATSLLLNLYFAQKPIFKLDEANLAIQAVKPFISNVIIEDGVIKVLLLE